jgi:hypothetical protein
MRERVGRVVQVLPELPHTQSAVVGQSLEAQERVQWGADHDPLSQDTPDLADRVQAGEITLNETCRIMRKDAERLTRRIAWDRPSTPPWDRGLLSRLTPRALSGKKKTSKEEGGMKAKSRKAEPAETTLKCKVSQGMFSSEWGVLVELPGGRKVSAFVDRRSVLVDREPSSGEEVDGRLKVYVVKSEKDSALVDLPQPAIAEGTRIRVPKELLG